MTTERSRRGRGRPPHPDILTPREWQVLDLLREGLTNEQIAQRLDVSLATAKYHVSEILTKLGLTSREQAAAWQPEADAVHWWQRSLAWIPRRALPLAAALAALAALGLVVWALGDPDEEQQAAAGPSPSTDAGPTAQPSSPEPTAVARPTSRHQLTYVGSDGSLYLINADGSGRTKFTDAPECVTASFPPLEWSPTGHRLACMASSPDRSQQTFAMLDESGQLLATMPASGVHEIAWSPSGNAVLRRSVDSITVVDSQGALIIELGPTSSAGSPGALGRYPLWSPDGVRIAYWAADAAELRIFSLESMSEQTVAGDYRPLAWLSRSESILVTANHETSSDGFGSSSWDVSLLDLTTGGLTRVPILDAGSPIDRPDGLPLRGSQQYWLSPSDHVVVLTARTDGLAGLGIYEPHSGTFTDIPDSVISYPSEGIPSAAVTFSEDGSQIYWLDFQRGTTIYRASIDGTGLQQVADVDSSGAALSPDMMAVAYTDFPTAVDDPITLYTAAVDGMAAIEIDSRPMVGGFGSPYPVVWRPRP